MFITMLDPAQREALLQCAAHIAHIDGMTAEDERQLLHTINVEADIEHLPDTTSDEAALLALLSDRFTDAPVQSGALLLELAGVALIDGHADPAEIAFLEAVTERLALRPERLADALDFARDAQALAQRGRDLIVSDAR